MNMIERVARAICAADSSDPDGITDEGKTFWSHYVDFARAAIGAMNGPTAEMIKAGAQAGPWTHDRYDAMISKALEETP